MRSFNSIAEKTITDAQYYQVLAAMQKGPLLPSRQSQFKRTSSAAVRVLCDPPRRAQTEIDPTWKSIAATSVKSYENINGLPILSVTLMGGDLVAKTQAALSLKTVIQNS